MGAVATLTPSGESLSVDARESLGFRVVFAILKFLEAEREGLIHVGFTGQSC